MVLRLYRLIVPSNQGEQHENTIAFSRSLPELSCIPWRSNVRQIPILHTTIVVYLPYLLRGLGLPNLAKFGLVSAISVPICFVVAFIITKIPGVSRVL